MKFDDVINELGDFGRYQKFVLFLSCLASFFGSLQIMAGVFIQATPKHRCSIPGLDNDTYESQGVWHDSLVQAWIPWDNSTDGYDECSKYRHRADPDNGTESCPRYVYSKETFQNTFVSQANLVCDRKHLATFASMVFMFGMLGGSLVFGTLSDTLGRKTVIMMSSICLFGTTLGVAWANSYIVYVVLRFFVSFFEIGVIIPAYVLGLELIGPGKRRLVNICNFFWSSGIFMLICTAYFIRDWRTLQIILSVPLAGLSLLYALCLPESPRWLLQKGRRQESARIVQRAAKTNGVQLSENASHLKGIEVAGQEESNLWRMFFHPRLIVRSLLIIFNWMVISMMYYGLSLNVGQLSGNIYLNFVLITVSELLSYTFMFIVLDILGRKVLLAGSMILGGLALAANMIPLMIGNDDTEWVTLVLSLVGKFGATVGFAVIWIITAELFPTVFRNSVIGVCSLCARIGGILAPFIGDLGDFIGGDYGVALPLSIFGSLSILAGVFVLPLPETSKQPLPETMDDVKNYGRSKPISKQLSATTDYADDHESRDNTLGLLERKV